MDELPVIEGLSPQEVAFLIASGEVEVEYEPVENVIETVDLILPAGFSSLAEFEDKVIWTPDSERERRETTTLVL
ncbi:hypothetical protein ACKFKG_03190 [Phormidesmis sp. 146-35]